MIPLLAALWTAVPVAGLPPCSVAQLSGCTDTNRLVWAKDFRPALAHFLGRYARVRVDYIYAGRLLPQIEDVLGGPPDAPRALPDGGMMFTACRPHSCTEKGAVAFDASGRMIVASIVSYRCPGGGKTCGGPTLDHYVRDAAGSAVARAAIHEWAIAQTQADDRVLHSGRLGSPIVHVMR